MPGVDVWTYRMLQGQCILSSAPGEAARHDCTRAHTPECIQDCCECCADIVCASFSSMRWPVSLAVCCSEDADIMPRQAARARCAAELLRVDDSLAETEKEKDTRSWRHDVYAPSGATCSGVLYHRVCRTCPVGALTRCTPDPRIESSAAGVHVQFARGSSWPNILPDGLLRICCSVPNVDAVRRGLLSVYTE